MDPYHIIHVKDDRFIGHGLNLSWKGKRPHPPRFMVVRTSTPLWSHRATPWVDGAAGRFLLEGWRLLIPPRGKQCSAGWLEGQEKCPKETGQPEPGEMSQSHYRKSGRESVKLRSRQGNARCSGGRGPSPGSRNIRCGGNRCGQKVYLRN